MLTFDQLTKKQQEKAIEHATNLYLKDFCEGAIEFVDPDLVNRFDAAVKKADAMHTPWFLSEYVWEDEILKKWIMILGHTYATKALYPEAGEYTININLED